jgi:hypothetical protein
MSSEAEVNARSVGSKIDDLQQCASNGNHKDFWALAKEISGLFKTLKPIRREDREQLWSTFSTVCDEAKAEQNAWRARSRKLADSILHDIKQAWPSSFTLSTDALRTSLKDLGVDLKRAGDALSEHKHEMSAEHKKECFDAIQETRAKHNECWDQVKGDQEKKRWRSEYLRSDILDDIERTRPCQIAILPAGVGLVTVDELKALGANLKQAGERLHNHKDEMFGEHKQECFKAIQDMREVHQAWWDSSKQQRAQNHEDWIARRRANLEKLYSMHQKATGALAKARAHADELREQIASAWNDDFRERAEGWLAEEEDRIRDIESSVERIEEWIREQEDKLN